MALVLNPKELEDLKPYVDKAVQRFVGLKEESVVNSALSLLQSGVDKSQFTSKIRALHPSLSEKAHKFADTIFEIATEYVHSLQQHQQKASKKRASSNTDGIEARAPKVVKTEEGGDQVDKATANPGQLSAMQIQQMMENAKRLIDQRKQALEAKGIVLPPPATSSPAVPIVIPPPGIIVPDRLTNAEANNNSVEKNKRIADLQAQIASKLAAGGFKPDEDQPSKPVPLLLDNEGRAIDVKGNQLLFPTRQPTLKANIRAQKRAEVKGKPEGTPVKEEQEEAQPVGNKYFDDRLSVPGVKKGLDRKKKALKFNDPGKYVTLANKQRTAAKLANLKNEIAEKARKTGIENAARLAKLSGTATTMDKTAEYIPQVEWWDSMILQESGDKAVAQTYDCSIKADAITNLIQHPTQMKCPTEPAEPILMPVFLTKKEQKKLRRQNRREAWRDQQEKIRLGVEPAPAAKVKLSNMMRVLGGEAVQDPTKVEEFVRKQQEKRLREHQEKNQSRKLTPEQKRAKKLRKLQEDTNLGVHVSVYRIDCLGNQAKRFKVNENAKQWCMTGTLVLYRECNVVVVEGGPKQQSKYRNLMMNRLKFEEDLVKDKEDTPNKCVLVWEGMVKERAFSDFIFRPMKTEDAVREFFKKNGVQHYWDAALSGTVLEAVLEND